MSRSFEYGVRFGTIVFHHPALLFTWSGWPPRGFFVTSDAFERERKPSLTPGFASVETCPASAAAGEASLRPDVDDQLRGSLGLTRLVGPLPTTRSARASRRRRPGRRERSV